VFAGVQVDAALACISKSASSSGDKKSGFY
jgi:hypothetical protein